MEEYTNDELMTLAHSDLDGSVWTHQEIAIELAKRLWELTECV